MRALAVCGAIEPPEFGPVLRSELRTLPPRRLAFQQGQPHAEIATIFDGWAFRFKSTLDGKRQILSFLLPGDPVILPGFAGTRMPFSVQALTSLTLCVFPREALEDYFFARAEAMRSVRHVVTYETLRSDERIVDLGRRSATERLARFFLETWVRLKERGSVLGDAFPFPVRQQHLADAFGLTPIHVNRVLNSFRRRKLIEFGHGSMTILDRSALIETAGSTEDELLSLEGKRPSAT